MCLQSNRYLQGTHMTAIKIEGAGYPIKDIFSDSFDRVIGFDEQNAIE